MDKVTIWKEFEYLIYNPEEMQPQELLMLNSYMRFFFFFALCYSNLMVSILWKLQLPSLIEYCLFIYKLITQFYIFVLKNHSTNFGGKIGFPKIRGRREYNSHVKDKL